MNISFFLFPESSHHVSRNREPNAIKHIVWLKQKSLFEIIGIHRRKEELEK